MTRSLSEFCLKANTCPPLNPIMIGTYIGNLRKSSQLPEIEPVEIGCDKLSLRKSYSLLISMRLCPKLPPELS